MPRPHCHHGMPGLSLPSQAITKTDGTDTMLQKSLELRASDQRSLLLGAGMRFIFFSFFPTVTSRPTVHFIKNSNQNVARRWTMPVRDLRIPAQAGRAADRFAKPPIGAAPFKSETPYLCLGFATNHRVLTGTLLDEYIG